MQISPSTPCRHGAKCPAKTICKFDHTNEELTSFKGEYEKAQEQSENDGGWSAPNGNFQARTVCRYLEKCGKGLKCGYLHSPEFTKSLRSWANQVDENETRQKTTKNGGNFVMMKVADLEALVERLESVTKLVKQFMPN